MFGCSPELGMRVLMQYLNGCALGGVWILLEHLDRLAPLVLSTLNKEIQMVQQQFIISELANDQSKSKLNITNERVHLSNP